MFAQVFFFWRAGLSMKKCHVIYIDKRLSGDTPQVKFWLGANALETDLGMIRDMTQWIDWWNRIFVSLSQGKRWYLEGTAKVIDPQEPAKLGVNFLSCRYLLYHIYIYIVIVLTVTTLLLTFYFCFWSLFPVLPYTPYWVLSTDYTNYSIAYSCKDVFGIFYFDFAWILARSPSLPPQMVDQAKRMLISGGIDISNMTPTDQSCSV